MVIVCKKYRAVCSDVSEFSIFVYVWKYFAVKLIKHEMNKTTCYDVTMDINVVSIFCYTYLTVIFQQSLNTNKHSSWSWWFRWLLNYEIITDLHNPGDLDGC